MVGKLIVFEGLDRSGKSTQCSKLVEVLNSLGYFSELLKFPNRTTQIGQIISQHLQNIIHLSDETFHLLNSANRWELSKIILEKLNSGINIILDRYIYSGLVYSLSKGLDFQWCQNSDKGLPIPDFIIFIDLDIDINK